MADTPKSGGTPSGAPSRRPSGPTGSQTPLTRQQRRAAGRRGTDPRLGAAHTVASAKPGWQSPMALMTGGAVLVGLLIVFIASSGFGLFTAKTATGLTLPITAATADLVDPADPRALGKADAKVTVDIWSDYQCPYCAQFATSTETAFIEQYVRTGKARLVYHDVIVIDPANAGTKGESHQSAAAARCAADQGAFWPYHDYLMANQDGENRGHFSAAFLASIADALKLDRTKFDACMANGSSAKLAEVQADTAKGKAAGVTSTPTIAVNGVLLAPAGQSTTGGAISLAELAKTVDIVLAGGAVPTPVPTTAP